MSQDALEAAAYHEAGHAVATYWYRLLLRSATIQPTEDYEGEVRHGNPLRDPYSDNSSRNEQNMKRLVWAALAGWHAEQRSGRHSYGTEWSQSDYDKAHNLINLFVGSQDEAEAYLKLLDIQAKNFVALPHIWSAISAVAQALLREKTLGRKKLRAIIQEALAEST